jgi:hypothetical protein
MSTLENRMASFETIKRGGGHSRTPPGLMGMPRAYPEQTLKESEIVDTTLRMLDYFDQLAPSLLWPFPNE